MDCSFSKESGITFHSTYLPVGDDTNLTKGDVPVWMDEEEKHLYVSVTSWFQWMEGDLDVYVGPQG